MKKLDLPPVWTILTILATALIAKIGPELGIDLHMRAPSFGIVLLGIALGGWAALTFSRNKTTIHPGGTPEKLLTKGPFRFTRNPIYTGMMLVTLGVALYYGEVFGFLPVIALFFVLDRKFVRPEEALLIETFGQEGRDYVQSVRRW